MHQETHQRGDTCRHCGQPLTNKTTTYCCAGCQTVAGIIDARGWGRFYQLRGADTKPLELAEKPTDFNYFKSANYRAKHIVHKENALYFTWYLNQVHCAACLWLVNQVSTDFKGVQSLNCRLEDGRTEIIADPDCDLPALAASFSEVGLSPTLGPADGDAPNPDLLRLGLSGAMAANIMLFSLPFYLGLAESPFAWLFASLAAGLSFPLIWIGGRPFFQHAWRSLKHRRFHFDQPISVGLASAFGLSLYQLILGRTDQIYFDSMAMLIFFLLLGRFLRSAVLQRARKASSKLLTSLPTMVNIWREGQWQIFEAEQIRADDILKLRAGDVLPVDGELLSAQATLNLQMVSGEARPVTFEKGGVLLAGAINTGQVIQVRANATAAEAELVQFEGLAKDLLQNRPKPEESKLAGFFLAGVTLAAGLGCIWWWPQSPQKGLEIALTIFIVACPCALALAGPTTHALALHRAAKLGIWAKNLRVFSVLPKIQEFIFDKTGILTSSVPKVSAVQHFTQSPRWLEAVVCKLEAEVDHPLSNALRQAFSPRITVGEVDQVTLHGGLGLSGQVEGKRLLIAGPHALKELDVEPALCHEATVACTTLPRGATHLCVILQNRLAAVIAVEGQIRPEAGYLFKWLNKHGVKTTILSGDRQPVVEALGRFLHADQALGQQKPQQKLAYVKASSPAHIAMMGDGLNDMGALAAAPLSLTHAQSSAAALQFADIIFAEPQLTSIHHLWELVSRANRAKRVGLFFSLSYNVTAVALALLGLIGPLIAAILMPLSSLTLVAITFGFFPKELRWAS